MTVEKSITLIHAGVQSAHGLLETNYGRTLRFRSHLSLLPRLDSYEGHIRRSGTRNNWFDRRGRRHDLCFAFTCLLGIGDNRVWRGILLVSGGLKGLLEGHETPNNSAERIHSWWKKCARKALDFSGFNSRPGTGSGIAESRYSFRGFP